MGVNSDTDKFIYTSSTFKATSVNGPAVYYLGIVDFLQDWTTKKKMERLFKIYVGRKDPEGLSVMEPISYMNRFQNKMEQVFDTTEPREDIKGLNEGEGISNFDDDSIRPHKSGTRNPDKFAYSIIDDETMNPIIPTDSPSQSILDISKISFESPPPRNNLSGARSIAGYVDDQGSDDGNETRRRDFHPIKVIDPYQYVYDNLTSNKNSSPPNSPRNIHGYDMAQVSVNKAIVKPEPDRYEEYNDYEDL